MKSRIAELEEELRIAMCESDINALDRLLSPDLVFTNHLGQVISKEDDINAHKNGVFSIEEIIFSRQDIIILKDSAVVTVQAKISGSFNEQPSNETLRFTRVWANQFDLWKVIAGHACIVSQ